MKSRESLQFQTTSLIVDYSGRCKHGERACCMLLKPRGNCENESEKQFTWKEQDITERYPSVSHANSCHRPSLLSPPHSSAPCAGLRGLPQTRRRALEGPPDSPPQCLRSAAAVGDRDRTARRTAVPGLEAAVRRGARPPPPDPRRPRAGH
eukprot:751755-Hanusia_phi.AAC.1